MWEKEDLIVRNEDTMKKIGLALKSCRISTGLKQKDVAERLGVKVNVITSWEIGRHLPDLFDLLNLSLIYGKTLYDLIGGSKETEKEYFRPVKKIIVHRQGKPTHHSS